MTTENKQHKHEHKQPIEIRKGKSKSHHPYKRTKNNKTTAPKHNEAIVDDRLNMRADRLKALVDELGFIKIQVEKTVEAIKKIDETLVRMEKISFKQKVINFLKGKNKEIEEFKNNQLMVLVDHNNALHELHRKHAEIKAKIANFDYKPRI